MTFYIITTGAPRPGGLEPEPRGVLEGPFFDEEEARQALQELAKFEPGRFDVVESHGRLFVDDLALLDSWSEEQALAAEKTWKASAQILPNPRSQWQTWHQVLPMYKERWESGDPEALLLAVLICSLEKVPVPKWCAKVCSDAIDKLRDSATSWDDVFGRPRDSKKWSRSFTDRSKRIRAKLDYETLRSQNVPKGEAKETVAMWHNKSVKTIERWLSKSG